MLNDEKGDKGGNEGGMGREKGEKMGAVRERVEGMVSKGTLHSRHCV